MPPEPLTLAFDTSVAHCAAALLSGDRLLAERCEHLTKGQAERLFPMLEEMLAGTNTTWADLTRIGVGIGPGNFTGTRIAVSAARGLALSLGIPAIGVSTFEAQALDAPRPVLSLVAAPAGRAHLQRFDTSTTRDPISITDDHIPPEFLTDTPAIVGHTDTATTSPRHTIAVAIARIAARAYPSAAPRPAPLYMRAADATPPRDAPPTILA